MGKRAFRPMVNVFLSYHHNARKIAGRLKDNLGALGMDAFLAHEDVEPSTVWQEEILRRLRQCDVFIPLLTRSYHVSLWTDQESGMALALKKHILPVKFSNDPYGFIGKFQALKAGTELEDTCWRVVQNLASRLAFKRAVRAGAINAFVRSGSFDESARRAGNLSKLEPFTVSQLRRIVEGAARNSQIYGGWVARDAVKKLIAKNRTKLSERLVREFEKRVESWGRTTRSIPAGSPPPGSTAWSAKSPPPTSQSTSWFTSRTGSRRTIEGSTAAVAVTAAGSQQDASAIQKGISWSVSSSRPCGLIP
jgi:hypothetical protein